MTGDPPGAPGEPELSVAGARALLGRVGVSTKDVRVSLVSCDDERPFQPGCPRFLATLRLAGDDVTDYLSIGGHFDLWLGSTVGDGIVTRRLFV